jgi:peptide chain release factor subunit 3
LGKVEAGTVRIGDDILISPTRKVTKVDAIYVEEKKVRFAKPGENILLKLAVNVEDIQRGFVLCLPSSPCRAVREVKVQLAMVDLLEHRPLFTQGYECVMHIHTAEIEVVCSRLVCVIVNQKPVRLPFAKQGQMCEAILSMSNSTCMETYASLPALGRLTLRDEGQTIAIGKVIDLVA